jgi:pimeloyl-ACP methyl ester carboxylesterase
MERQMAYDELTFPSGGVECSAWLFPATDDKLANDVGRPVVVMAHGLGGTKDSGLASFAAPLAEAGLDVLAFDYRGFGASAGHPRQIVSVAGQLADYRAALAAAARLPGIDAQRLVLWGESLSGGTVIAAGAGRTDVAAVVSMVPLVDGLAAGRYALASYGVVSMARSSAKGVAAAFNRGEPAMMPLVSNAGQVAAMGLPGYYDDYLSIAGPTWRNEVGAKIGAEIATFRPGTLASKLRCPWLVQIADFDRSAPPHSAAKAAFKGRAEVRHYPCDHFDTQVGKVWHEQAVAHQVAFLSRHLAPKAS